MVSSHWPNPLEEGKMIRYFLHEWQSHKCQLESPFLSMLGFGIILLKVTSLTLHGISLKCNVIVVKFMKLGRKCFSSSQEILGGGRYWAFLVLTPTASLLLTVHNGGEIIFELAF